jgi:hypothetical protein
MTIKNDLSSLKVGDKVFRIPYGEEEVIAIIKNEVYTIQTKNLAYTIEGKYLLGDKHPSLFLSAKHASEYFASIKEKKKIHVKCYVHHILGSTGKNYTITYTLEDIKPIINNNEKYLGCTEINKTYEIEE